MSNYATEEEGEETVIVTLTKMRQDNGQEPGGFGWRPLCYVHTVHCALPLHGTLYMCTLCRLCSVQGTMLLIALQCASKQEPVAENLLDNLLECTVQSTMCIQHCVCALYSVQCTEHSLLERTVQTEQCAHVYCVFLCSELFEQEIPAGFLQIVPQ